MKRQMIVAGLVLCGSPLYGQSYPTKPIRMVAPTAGGGIDFIARVIAPFLTANLGQQVIIDNRGGAGGIIAVETVIRSKPDGYTLLCYGPPAWINPLLKKNISYDPLKDLSPVGLITRTANLLVVHPSLPVKTVKDLINLAKAQPGQLLDAGSDTGSSAHLAAELFKSMAGVSITRVPYKGVGAGIGALISGEVQVMLPAISAAMPHVKSGRLRALGVSTAEPTTLAPGVPAIAASGLRGFVVESQNAIFAPADTPAAIIERLNQELNRVLRNPDVRERLLVGGTEPTGGTPHAALETIKADMAKWAKVIKDLGIRED
ncbi:MAG TPA: tripartite tricarboxylate transporter substrate binding protein [Chthoniobacterales bacterium]|nr:tripartite tricarboxylate transporter substrate binding protein [Chthoniobacterales bacterium]